MCWNNKKDKNLQGGVLVDCQLFLAHTKKIWTNRQTNRQTDVQTDQWQYGQRSTEAQTDTPVLL